MLIQIFVYGQGGRHLGTLSRLRPSSKPPMSLRELEAAKVRLMMLAKRSYRNGIRYVCEVDKQH